MSFSTQDRPTNPSKYFLKLSAGKVHYYDKEAGENQEVPTPLEFVMLDQLGTVKGWSDADGSGFWSNEVKRSGSDPLTVKTKAGTKATGLWKDIKNEPALSGAKFNASVYIAHKSGDGLVISNVAFQGAALNAWIEFIQANKSVSRGKNKAILSGWDDGKKGAVSYKIPHFEVGPELTDEERAICTDLDTELQTFLAGYFTGQKNEPVNGTDEVHEVSDDDRISLDDIPFN